MNNFHFQTFFCISLPEQGLFELIISELKSLELNSFILQQDLRVWMGGGGGGSGIL